MFCQIISWSRWSCVFSFVSSQSKFTNWPKVPRPPLILVASDLGTFLVRWGRARGRWSPNREVYPLFGHWPPPPPPPEVGWACLPTAWPPDLCQNLLPQKVNVHLFTNLFDLWWCYKGVAHTCVHKDPIDKLANKCFSFMFPGFVQPVRGKRMLASRVRERMRGVFRDGSTHVARRLWSACSNLEDIAHEWPTTTIRRPLAKPLTNLDQSSSQTWFRLCLTLSNTPSISHQELGSGFWGKFYLSNSLLSICPVSIYSLFPMLCIL